MPELPAEFRRRYRQLGLPAADVLVLADELPTAHYFDSVLAAGAAAKPAANWIMGDIMAFCKVWRKGFASLCLPLLLVELVGYSMQLCSSIRHFVLFVLQSISLVSIFAGFSGRRSCYSCLPVRCKCL